MSLVSTLLAVKIEDCEFPENLLYDVTNGTWARMERGSLEVGITSLVAWASGPFNAVTFKLVGTEVKRGQVIGSFEGARHFDVFRSPVSGSLLETNSVLLTNPRVLNKDCYGKGWFSRIRVAEMEELGYLSSLPESSPLFEASLKDRRVHCFAEFPDQEMFEIGVECSAVLVRLNEFFAGCQAGTVVHVVSDDTTAEIEMERWSEETGNRLVQSKREGNLQHFIVKKEGRTRI